VFIRRVPILVLAVAALVVGALAFEAPASAQERVHRGWSLRDLLFPRKSDRLEPPARVQRTKPRTKKRSTPRKPAEPEAPVVDKTANARVVLVVGDFMAGGLAEGLEAVFAENPAVRISDRSKGSSGFVRDDFYDWPAEIGPLLESEKPAAVIVMIGSNDRQQMRIGDASEPPRSANWTRQYEARAEAFGKTIEAGKVPLLWVGMPAFKSARMTSDMLAFNDIYKAAAEKSGGEFIDVWDGFVDENGAFVAMGPDMNGQPVRLRSDDGINLTRAGKRKLAFYTEKPLMKILGLSPSPGAPDGTAPAGLPLGPSAVAPAAVDRTAPILLSDPALDGGTELLGATPPPARRNDELPGRKLAVEGTAPDPSPGRADDFSWPKPQPRQTATAAETTTAIQP
jgi:hypothetical protein